jgi:hypothetical protein
MYRNSHLILCMFVLKMLFIILNLLKLQKSVSFIIPINSSWLPYFPIIFLVSASNPGI